MNQPVPAQLAMHSSDDKSTAVQLQLTEKQLVLAIEAARLGMWELDLQTQELIWSDRCKELFGLSPNTHVTYDFFLERVHPDDRERTDQAVQEALDPAGNRHYDIEYRALGAEPGTFRWLRANGQSFFDHDQTPLQFVGTVIDITDSKRNEETLRQQVLAQTQALEQQTHQLRAILDASINSILAMTAIRDSSGDIIDFRMDRANESVVKSNFMTPDQMIGQTVLTLFPGNKDNGFFDLYKRVVDTEQAEQSTQPYRDELGLEGWFEVSAVKFGDDGVVVTYNNITERKQHELTAQQQANELREANAELKRSNESLQQFAHIASHDLQEPLRRIQAFSDILQNQFVDNISDGEADMVTRIQRSAHRMQMLVKDLLTYSQLSTQREPLSRVTLNAVLDDVLNDLEISISEKQADIRVADLPVVLGTSARLRQLFQNLIANALKFIPTNVKPVIQIDCQPAAPNDIPPRLSDRQNEKFWMITVVDNGIGFDERYKDRIFNPFQRLHGKNEYSGTGIGLAICQRVAESHGGAIDVSSTPGKGSTFRVFLPVQSS